MNSAALAVGSAAAEFDSLVQTGQQLGTNQPMAPLAAESSNGTALEPFIWNASGLSFSFDFTGNRLRFPHVLPEGAGAPQGLPPSSEISALETSLHCTGENIPDHHGAKFSGGSPGIYMAFAEKHEEATARGRRLILSHAMQNFRVESFYETVGAMPVVRRWTRVTNTGKSPVEIEYLSSAMLNNFAAPETFQNDLLLHFAFNSWRQEAQWRSVRLADAGLIQNGSFSVSGALFSTTGSWPCEKYLPMAMVENTRAGVTWFWQVEHNGSWHCEIAQTSERSLYAYLGGPDALHSQAWKNLQHGETYESIPVAIGCVRGGFEEAVAALTQYRRAIQQHRRSDHRACPVVFNDVVMLEGDQTTADEMPLIDAAAAVGCEVYCMDVGWYAKPGENWWGPVGDWMPNPQRFPGGLKKLTDYIRSKGMVPGLWIEPEVAGFNTALSRRPDNWFFVRHGRRILDHTRYQLDFRNPDVRAYIDRVFDRLIGDYGIGYIKLDYNINALEGTELNAESFGQGLLGHNRAFLAWLDALLDRYPSLTMETVASGSMRMEYSMLSRAQLQSISDQDDYRLYASLTTGCSAAVLPEQMGVWSQPLAGASPAAVSCNLVNAMLGRIHQSGFLTKLAPESVAQVREGIAVYKRDIRRYLPQCTPFYPLGMSGLTQTDQSAALGMRAPDRQFLAVWRRSGPETVRVPGSFAGARLLYPATLGIHVAFDSSGVTITFPKEDMGCIVSA